MNTNPDPLHATVRQAIQQCIVRLGDADTEPTKAAGALLKLAQSLKILRDIEAADQTQDDAGTAPLPDESDEGSNQPPTHSDEANQSYTPDQPISGYQMAGARHDCSPRRGRAASHPLRAKRHGRWACASRHQRPYSSP